MFRRHPYSGCKVKRKFFFVQIFFVVRENMLILQRITIVRRIIFHKYKKERNGYTRDS